jgi:hypothetical protein
LGGWFFFVFVTNLDFFVLKNTLKDRAWGLNGRPPSV